ncbi:MAG: hypothetical protein HN742_39010 [Lentisphaerae bacterium]|jgi:hypothetical protein|nr:hypothetical protein [Lentisphaerota bacterium]MBT4816004.1 hypothetical protein [Lentisphaerota bacterium]MBT5604527.1 hypothetical protein [Lentisphaerota bacterium]MBT7061922.1 hypothetical protein [Lentisphaerota bacterium]MBT7847922.1 hypothetical protein [Lentisphaerota bacterium]
MIARENLWCGVVAVVMVLTGGLAWSQEKQQPEAPVGPVVGRQAPLLDRLRQEQPEEYERLVKMREDDPTAFKKALRRRMESSGRVGPGRRFGPQGPQRGEMGRRMKEGSEWMERLSTEKPEEFQRLLKLRESDPQAFSNELRKFVQERRGSGHRPGRMDTDDRKCQELSRLYHATEDPAEKNRIRGELRAEVEAAFDRKIKVRGEWIDEMLRKIEEGRKRLAERGAQRTQICDDRVHELTRDPKLKWDQRW